jgi:hypothetical protein
LTLLFCLYYADDEDDYDKHDLSGHDSKFRVMTLGICYVVVAFAYLAITGELFSFVETEDDEPAADSDDSHVSV